jgi:hypothetical protein
VTRQNLALTREGDGVWHLGVDAVPGEHREEVVEGDALRPYGGVDVDGLARDAMIIGGVAVIAVPDASAVSMAPGYPRVLPRDRRAPRRPS